MWTKVDQTSADQDQDQDQRGGKEVGVLTEAQVFISYVYLAILSLLFYGRV